MKKALLLLLVLVLAGLTMVALRAKPEAPSPLALQLEGLRAENGLYFHPSLLGPGMPSLSETAYADQVLAMAGQHPPAPSDRTLLTRELTDTAVWNRWYVEQIDHSTGMPTPGLEPSRVLDAAQSEGWLLDDVAPAPDEWTRLATTVAGLDVLGAHGVAVSSEVRRRMGDWVAARSAMLSNPYQACMVAAASRALEMPVPEAVGRQVTTWRPPASLGSDEAVLDVEGYACLGGNASTELRTQIRARLSDDIDAFTAFHLARAWIGFGGSPGELSQVAGTLAARRLPSGLFAAKDRKIGTIDTAYAVTEIRELTGIPQQDLLLGEAVEQFVATAGKDLDAGSLARAALVMRRTGRPDGGLAQRAASALAAPPPVTSDTVLTWVQWRRLQVKLTPEAPVPRVVGWPADTRESRFKAWALLSVTSRAQVPAELLGQLDALPGVLERETLSVREVRAGVEALRNFGVAVPADAVRRTLGATKGCAGLPDLYRAEGSATTCDIGSTVDAYWLAGAL